MKQFNYIVTDPFGLHARPAGIIVKTAMTGKSNLSIQKENSNSVDMKKIFAVMSLGAKQGETLTVTIDGEDELEMYNKLLEVFKANV